MKGSPVDIWDQFADIHSQRQQLSFQQTKKAKFQKQKKNLLNSPGEKSAMALRQLYSAVSTCNRFSLSTWSWNTLTWSMKDTTRSADMGDE